MRLFKTLDDAEAAAFKKWARDNYRPFEPIKGIWHPTVQTECMRMNVEASASLALHARLTRGAKPS